MRIKQGFISKSIDDFPFLQVCCLDYYNNDSEPCIFFGCYRYEDYLLIKNHRGFKAIFWGGQDAINNPYLNDLKEVNHFTYHSNVVEQLKPYFKVNLIKPLDFGSKMSTAPNGNKVYAYVPSSASDYHGGQLVNELKKTNKIIVGDGSHSQEYWRNGKCNEYYDQCFVGLCLSEFAGGGSTIIELGLRGKRCITNVFTLPNCISWKTLNDVEIAIQKERENIGIFNFDVARNTRQNLGILDFLETNFYQ